MGREGRYYLAPPPTLRDSLDADFRIADYPSAYSATWRRTVRTLHPNRRTTSAQSITSTADKARSALGSSASSQPVRSRRILAVAPERLGPAEHAEEHLIRRGDSGGGGPLLSRRSPLPAVLDEEAAEQYLAVAQRDDLPFRGRVYFGRPLLVNRSRMAVMSSMLCSCRAIGSAG
jgi:hypothetical protein